MLRWRLIIGALLIATLAGLCWLDVHASRPALSYLAPLVLGVQFLATGELLELFRRMGIETRRTAVYCAVLLATCAAFWPAVAQPSPSPQIFLGVGLMLALLVCIGAELAGYKEDKSSSLRLVAAAFAILYLGGGMGFMVLLRQISIAGEWAHGGMFALLSMLAVVKGTDIGAYTVGRLVGRHKMSPRISPGKTWEGFLGGILSAAGIAALMFGPVARVWDIGQGGLESSTLAIVCFGICVGVAGVVGDLAESLLKRDAAAKDSSTWLPGFGGVLDIVDSPLLAAPVAYLFWVSGVLSP